MLIRLYAYPSEQRVLLDSACHKHDNNRNIQRGFMTPFGTKLYTWLFGEYVGMDAHGNRYYRTQKADAERRWVIYKGLDEASKVPAEWHGWLHKNIAEPPADNQLPWPWQKPHLPNLTGTSLAYKPPGHPLAGNKRKIARDYEPWQP